MRRLLCNRSTMVGLRQLRNATASVSPAGNTRFVVNQADNQHESRSKNSMRRDDFVARHSLTCDVRRSFVAVVFDCVAVGEKARESRSMARR